MELWNSLDPTRPGLLASGQWLRVVNDVCALGVVLALVSIWRRLAGRDRGKSALWWAQVGVFVAAIGTHFWSVWLRYREVNHFPSQTMSEVLSMTTLFLLISLAVLQFALGLQSMGSRWAILGDALSASVFCGVWAINGYSQTLSTAQRDLPPALQSYWFPPHLCALIFSYGTLTIAGVIALIYFCIRFWSGVFSGGRTRASQLLILGLLALLPFAQLVTLPVLLVVGAAFLVMKLTGHLPSAGEVSGIERSMDAISYRAFCVGIPFLTAGLFMGAFWAQDAWANYWGWDSKENSALITWLVYVVYIHLRMLGGYRGEKAMAVLVGGALSVFLTFQIFGYLPDSQKSLHRYTDDGVVPREGMQGATSVAEESARLEEPR